MKQNKKYLAIFCVVLMLISIVSISSFAYTDNSTNNIDFSGQPLYHNSSINTNYNPSDVISNFNLIADRTNSQNNYYTWYSGSNNINTYAFGVISGGSVYFWYASSESNTTVIRYNFENNTSNFNPPLSVSLSQYDANNSLYFNSSTSVSYTGYSFYIPIFNSRDDGLNAVRDWIDNPPVSSSSYPLSIQLPAGNILIAIVGGISNNHYRLETSGGTTGATAKPGLNNIQIGYLNSLPQTFTLPSSLLEYPPYWAGTGKQSIFGTFNRQAYTHTMDGSTTYFVVGNPMYPNDNNASANRLNPDLYITIDSVISYQIVDLKTGYVNGTLTGENDGSSYIDYTYDESTGDWVGINQDGNPSSPVWGGQNDFSNTPTTINDWLENIAHQIGDFFTGAIGAVNTLISAGRSFFNVLTGLYSWLPPAVFSVLTSALVIVITIGVVKVFI